MTEEKIELVEGDEAPPEPGSLHPVDGEEPLQEEPQEDPVLEGASEESVTADESDDKGLGEACG